MLFDRLNFVDSNQEIILTPKSFYTQKNSTLQVLRDQEVEQKARSLTLLQRNKSFQETSSTDKKENISNESILKSLDMLTAASKKNERIFEQKMKFLMVLTLMRLVNRL